MVAQERAIRFGCALAAALFVLVLAGCADVSESGSSPRAQPSKKNPPTETAERPTLLAQVGQPSAPPSANRLSPTCSDLSTSRGCACQDEPRRRVCTLRSRSGCRRVQADPQSPDRVLAGQP
jgi:hypothetical protein